MKQLLECDSLAGFGLQECRSALPKRLEGLTDVQRKIMYEALRRGKRNIRMNVNGAGTDFASRTKYHHAPQSMQETLMLLASNKPGRCCISPIRGVSSVESRHAPGRESMPSPRYADVDVMPELLTLLFPAQHYETQQLLQMERTTDGEKAEFGVLCRLCECCFSTVPSLPWDTGLATK